MSIPKEVLNNLKCFYCETYLVRSPVYLEHTGEAVCGSCFTPERPATRMKQYEEIAKLHVFPCKNEDIGCQVEVPFDNTESHNDICQYRQYVCPILGSSRCEWLGPKADFLKHCEEAHPDSIKDNPVTLVHDITKSNEHNFLLRAFQLLFLLHTKVCVTSGKIHHAIRYLGRSDEAKNFVFTLNIKRDEEIILRKGNVTNQGCLSIQEDTSLILNINSLLDMLGGFDNTSFTITLKRLDNSLEKCVKCKSSVSELDYYSEGGWWCDRCAPAKEACKNSVYGCTFYDFANKCNQHLWNFCEHMQAYDCKICKKRIPRGPLLEHYNSYHQNKICKQPGNIWRTKWTEDVDYYFVPCVAGTAISIYRIRNNVFEFRVRIPVSSVELRKYKCSVRVVQVSTGQVRNYTPDIDYNENSDWYIRIDETDFPRWSDEFDVQVNITKVKP